MKYVEARIGEVSTDLLYRGFVTEELKIITKNTANSAGGDVMSKNFIEFLQGRSRSGKVDTRTAEEVVQAISDRLDALGGNE